MFDHSIPDTRRAVNGKSADLAYRKRMALAPGRLRLGGSRRTARKVASLRQMS
jgi:hypothetical protein